MKRKGILRLAGKVAVGENFGGVEGVFTGIKAASIW
jgi:hypothetical protein